MKLVALTSAALLAATTAFAGTPGPAIITDPPLITPTEPGSGSAGWLVPAIAVVLIAAAVVAASDDDD